MGELTGWRVRFQASTRYTEDEVGASAALDLIGRPEWGSACVRFNRGLPGWRAVAIFAIAPSGLSPARHQALRAQGESIHSWSPMNDSRNRIAAASFLLGVAKLPAIPGFSELIYSIHNLRRF